MLVLPITKYRLITNMTIYQSTLFNNMHIHKISESNQYSEPRSKYLQWFIFVILISDYVYTTLYLK